MVGELQVFSAYPQIKRRQALSVDNILWLMINREQGLTTGLVLVLLEKDSLEKND